MKTDSEVADYGIDAPNVIRNLALAAAALFLLFLATLVGLLPKVVSIPVGSGSVGLALGQNGLFVGAGFAAAACFMYFGSKYGKISERNKLLDRIPWRGDERVLDVGCGRGLILVGAAKRLTTGSATGVDIWQAEDLSGNRPEVPLRNAEIEGVAGRVTVKTADMRKLPFEDGAFDVVVSRAAIHNLYSAPDRQAAIREIARVLKPGGRAVIADIRHFGEYARSFAEGGCSTRLLDSKLVSALFGIVTFGSLRPNTMLVEKGSSR